MSETTSLPMPTRVAVAQLKPPPWARWLPRTRGQWLLFTLLVFAGITVLSLSADLRMPSRLGFDKLGHVTAYFVLMSGLMHVLARRWWALLAIGCCLLAVAFEGLQSLTPTRTMSLWDAAASALGVWIAWRVARSG